MFEQLQKYDEAQKLKKQKKKKRIIIIVMFLILLITAGIIIYFYLNSPKEAKKTKKVDSIKIVDINSNKRPIAVMIDNNVGNEAHAGLDKAYITYEAIVEGGLTRIMALYKDKDVSLIGPVRSSRHYFLDYALENDALYAHYGWSTYAENDIKVLGVNNLNGMNNGEAAFWRDNQLESPHNVFTSTDDIYKTAKNLDYDIESYDWLLLNYSSKEINLYKEKTENNDSEYIEEEDEAVVANTVIIPYSNSEVRSYIYDSKTKTYLRFMNDSPHIDKVTGKQLRYKNIIIQSVNNTSLDSYGRQDLDTTEGGEGYYITNGYAKKIWWTKSSRSDKIKYAYDDGSEIKINDGNTFIQVQPSSLESTFE